MLSRHAEDLYWTGRYVERAEDTARLLDVTYHGLLESAAEPSEAWREVLEVLFLDDAFAATDGDLGDGVAVTDFLVLDEAAPGSISASVGQARANARGLRDRISTELWEAINGFYLELGARDLRAELERHPYDVYRWVRDHCQMVAGVAAETMPRDDGYRFLLLGRFLERAEMTCRLLAVRYNRLGRSGQAQAFHWWLALLKSVSAFEAYLKEHRASVDPNRVLEFLLLSPDFPRSVLFCLREAEEQLTGVVADGERVAAQRVLGRVRAGVEYCDVAEVVASDLGGYLDELQKDIWGVGDALDVQFFKHGADLDLHAYESV